MALANRRVRRTSLIALACLVPTLALAAVGPINQQNPPHCPRDWQAVAARAADATWTWRDGDRVVDRVVMALGVWSGGPEKPTADSGTASYHVVRDGPEAPLRYELTAYAMTFSWPFAVDWDRRTLPANFSLTSAPRTTGGVDYTLTLAAPVTAAVADGALSFEDPAAAVPGFLIWGKPVAQQSYGALVQDYLPIRARQSTLFPDYPTARCATLTTQESTQWGLNPVAGEWTGTTGSWMDAARRGEAAEVLDRYRELAF